MDDFLFVGFPWLIFRVFRSPGVGAVMFALCPNVALAPLCPNVALAPLCPNVALAPLAPNWFEFVSFPDS